MKFDQLGLHPHILRVVSRQGYSTATPIQAAAIPLLLEGHDLLGCAQTGTGKTAAFALPTIQLLMPERSDGESPERTTTRSSGRPNQGIQALVLTPTRELANQVSKSFATYGRGTGLRHTVIYGGVSQNPQVRGLRAGANIVVATPGRLLDLIEQGHVKLGQVKVLILDEADQMLDMGFIQDLTKIVRRVPKERQTLMFSATMSPEIRELADRWLRDPQTVKTTPTASTPEKIKQSVTFVEKPQKPTTLVRFLQSVAGERQLVFCRTKRGADRVVRYLERAKIYAVAIHGDKSQNARERALAQFCSNRPPVLVATDVAARGLHMPGISHVINYDLPEAPEVYVHRIGRTARAGAEGESVSFCSRDERPYLKRIERLIRQAVNVQKLSGSDAGENAPQPNSPSADVRPSRPAYRPTGEGGRGKSKPPRRSQGSGAPVGYTRTGNHKRPGRTPRR